ncbi:hypothetical protein DH2020_025903 [Rehmannia glutinosa]|uniref:Peptidase A1 domain-containing protein n=1 Tax=Rehmannia glutinosa TaxID=99300 RepID=A0ABR0W2R8_REHGL
MKTLLFSIATLFFSVAQGLLTPNCDTPHDHASTLQLMHINSPCSPFSPKTPLSWADTVLQMQSNDKTRLQYLSSLASGRSIVPIAAVTQNPAYVVRARIGTPAQTLLVAMDTSNDAAWIPCAGCVGCSSTTFDTARSSTFKTVPCGDQRCNQVPNPSCGGTTCGFNLSYGGSTFAASLVQDTLALASDPITSYSFGCIQRATGTSLPPQGLLGLGRGLLSLLSQTPNLYHSIFSYCLPNYKSVNFSGSLKVGGHVVKIPPSAFAFDPNTGAGTVLDSGNSSKHNVHESCEAGVHGGERRAAAPVAQRHRVVAGRVRHVLHRAHRRAHHNIHVRKHERDAPSGQLPNPQHRRHHLLPGHGGGAGKRQLRSQHHRQLPAAEPPYPHR